MLKTRFLRSEFSQNVFKLITGSAIAQVIAVCFAPVLTRIYSPDDFGVFALYMSIISAASIIASARYEQAIVLAKSDEDAKKLFQLSFIVCIAVSFFSALLLFFLFIAKHYFEINIRIGKTALLFIPGMIFLTGSFQIIYNWASRVKIYSQISASRITNSFFAGALNFSIGLKKAGALGLFAGTFIAQLFSTVLLGFFCLKKNKAPISYAKRKEIKEISVSFIDFPKTNLPFAIIGMLQMNSVIYLLPFLFESAVIGQYSRSMLILQAPMSLMGAAFAQIFYQHASGLFHEKKDLKSLVRKTIFTTALLGLPVFAALIFFGPDLFAFVFGNKWRIAGEYARILSPWIFLDFIRASVSQLPVVINRQKEMLLYSLLGLILLITSMLIGNFFYHNASIVFTWLAAGQSAFMVLMIRWIYKISSK